MTLAEGDGAAHGHRYRRRGLRCDILLTECFPAADDAGGVIDFEGVVRHLSEDLGCGH